jgi:hypothetical protein
MKVIKQPVPVYIFDEHNEAFYYWYKAKSEGYLTEAADLFHVDAHDDMGRPEAFRNSIYCTVDSSNDRLEYYKKFAAIELHHGNFIIPAILAGLVRNVYFIYPAWRKYKPKRERFNVSSIFGEGKILKYGMKAEANMEEQMNKALPDLKDYLFRMTEINKIPPKRDVILDIDIDYFACRDSILNQYCYELEITPQQFQRKEEFLHDSTLKFASLDFTFLKRGNKCFVQVAHKKIKDASHLPSKDKIISEIKKTLNILSSKGIRPALVTITRSCVSGYCPKEYVELIEIELKQQLKYFLGDQAYIVADGRRCVSD